jgi:hypothetical protein
VEAEHTISIVESGHPARGRSRTSGGGAPILDEEIVWIELLPDVWIRFDPSLKLPVEMRGRSIAPQVDAEAIREHRDDLPLLIVTPIGPVFPVQLSRKRAHRIEG